MVQAKQPTQEQLRAMQAAQNAHFIGYSYEQPTMAFSENGNDFKTGRTLNFSAPIISGAYATKLVLRHKLNVKVTGVGTVTPTAAFPFAAVNSVEVTFGNRQISMHPIVAKIQQLMQGYGRTMNDKAINNVSTSISNLVNKVPTAFVAGDNELIFDTDLELNALHPASVNGILPLFSSGTRLQVAVVLPTTVASDTADALDNLFETETGTTVEVTGKIEVVVMYRDYTSMADGTQPIQPNLQGLSTAQIIQLPSITGLSPKTYNFASFRNPYRFAKLVHIILDGKQSDKFADAANITGYRLDKAENSNSSFFNYENEVGMSTYYKEIRSRFGSDMDEGVIVFDATTQNLSEPSSKLGTAYLNLDASKGGYSAARFGFKLDTVAQDSIGRAPRVISYGVILNDDGIKGL